jgi:tRNA(His) 5'-end guanylyltransferase
MPDTDALGDRMAARCFYSHKELHGKTGPEMQEMMFRKGQNWDNYPDFFKRGTYVQRRKRLKVLSEEELSRIPLQYRPSGPVERTEVVCLQMPPMLRISNRVGVIFDGEDPAEISKET